MRKTKIFLVLGSIILLAQAVFPCTAVFDYRDKLIGRTMDWPTGDTNVTINERGVHKVATMLQDKSAPAEWTSRYGSVSFNPLQKLGLLPRLAVFVQRIKIPSPPNCGINEKGLYGGSFWIHPPPAVKYPARDQRKSLNDWQVLQYMLDNCASVSEVITKIEEVRVSGFDEAGFEVDLHWFFADASGDCAILEYPNGKLEVHRRPAIPVITNSFYEHTREYAKRYQGFGGTEAVPLVSGETTTENRFAFAATTLREMQKMPKLSINDVLAIMKSATQTKVRHAHTSQALTQWTTAYDLNKREIYWFSRLNPKIRSIRLADINFSPSGKERRIDINAQISIPDTF